MNENTSFSIGELCNLAGVSRRTLQHYDDIGLLTPERRADNGYRQYTEADALRLKQILIYRELEFSTKDIASLLDAKNFDLFRSLNKQRELLAEKKKSIEEMIANLEHSIENIKSRSKRNMEILYEGIPKEKSEYWQQAAKDRAGEEAWEINLQLLSGMSEDDARNIKERGDRFYANYAEVLQLPVTAPEVQKLVGEFIESINKLYAHSVSDFEGLGYEECLMIARTSVELEDVKDSYNYYGEGLAEHLSEAIVLYAQENLC